MGAILALTYMVLEVVISLQVADAIGTLATVLWLILALILGMGIIRVQGPLRMMQAAQAMREGKRPEASLAAGFFGALAGFLILLPGFLSDALGLILLLPIVQRWIIGRIKTKVQDASVAAHMHFTQQYGQDTSAGNVYEGEVETESEKATKASLESPNSDRPNS